MIRIFVAVAGLSYIKPNDKYKNRGISGIMTSFVSTLEHIQVPNGTGQGDMRSKRNFLACHTNCKYWMETFRYKIKV